MAKTQTETTIFESRQQAGHNCPNCSTNFPSTEAKSRGYTLTSQIIPYLCWHVGQDYW